MISLLIGNASFEEKYVFFLQNKCSLFFFLYPDVISYGFLINFPVER